MDPTQKQNDILGNQPSVNGPSGVGYPPVAGSQPVVSDGSSVGSSPVPDTRPSMVNQSLVGDSPTVSGQSPMGVSNTGGLMDVGGVNGPVGVGISNQPMNAGQFGGLNNIGNQSVPMSTGTGDIILAPEKKSKKWWIVGVVGVAALILVGLIIVFLLNAKKTSISVAKDSWNDYYDYLMFGPDGEKKEVTIENWYPALLVDMDLDNGEIYSYRQQYYFELKTRFEDFYNKNKDYFNEIDMYADMVKGFVDYQTLSQIENTVYSLYESDGPDDASSYIQSLTATFNRRAADLYGLMREYLNIRLELMAHESSRSCFKDNSLDVMCVETIEDSSVADVYSRSVGLHERIELYYNNYFVGPMFAQTKEFNDEMEWEV